MLVSLLDVTVSGSEIAEEQLRVASITLAELLLTILLVAHALRLHVGDEDKGRDEGDNTEGDDDSKHASTPLEHDDECDNREDEFMCSHRLLLSWLSHQYV